MVAVWRPEVSLKRNRCGRGSVQFCHTWLMTGLCKGSIRLVSGATAAGQSFCQAVVPGMDSDRFRGIVPSIGLVHGRPQDESAVATIRELLMSLPSSREPAVYPQLPPDLWRRAEPRQERAHRGTGARCVCSATKGSIYQGLQHGTISLERFVIYTAEAEGPASHNYSRCGSLARSVSQLVGTVEQCHWARLPLRLPVWIYTLGTLRLGSTSGGQRPVGAFRPVSPRKPQP